MMLKKRSSTDDLVVAMTGASGTLYATRLIEVLIAAGRTVHLTISPAAVEVASREQGHSIDLNNFDPRQWLNQDLAVSKSVQNGERLVYHHFRNYSAGIASGSFLTGGMVICPCSMGTLASIATGQSQNLIHRAADVHLKERRKLVVVPRETPLSLIALENMKRLTEAGGVILPAMPGFYMNPLSIMDLVDFIVARICDQLGVDHQLIGRWGAGSEIDGRDE